MKQARKIDTNGLFVCDIFVEDDFEQTADIIIVPCPNGFGWPLWDGSKWVEGINLKTRL